MCHATESAPGTGWRGWNTSDAVRPATAAEVAAEAGVGEQQRFGVTAALGGALALDGGELVGDAGERLLPARPIAPGLLGVAADDEAAPGLLRDTSALEAGYVQE